MDQPVTETTLLRLLGDGLAVCYRGAAGYEARLTPDAALIFSGEAVADLNYAVIATGPTSEARFHEFSQAIQARGLPIVLIMDAALSEHVAALAQEDGFQHVGALPVMTYQTVHHTVQPTAHQITRVTTLDDLHAANRIAAQAFSLAEDAMQRAFGAPVLDAPGFDLFLARQDLLPVGAAQTSRFGTAVGIWAMVTAPDHQRKGVGRALLNYLIAYHCGRGASLFYLLATEAGYPLYARTGFQTAVEAPVWVVGHSTQAPIVE